MLASSHKYSHLPRRQAGYVGNSERTATLHLGCVGGLCREFGPAHAVPSRTDYAQRRIRALAVVNMP